jgi:hypothetical protein
MAQSLPNHDLRWFRYDPVAFVVNGAKCGRCALHVGWSVGTQFRQLNSWGARALWLISFPVGLGADE